MAIIITWSDITTPQIDSVVVNENGLSVATEQYVDGKMVLDTASFDSGQINIMYEG